MGQALGGIAEAYSNPGQPLRTGIVSVADESCAILTFGGILAALRCAETTGVGQKVDTSLLGSAIRLMGWTMTTTMWRDRNPVTGQARITGTAERPGISASFSDKNGKPFVFQLGGVKWKSAMTALGFYPTLEEKGLGDLGITVTSEDMRALMLDTLDALFATDTRVVVPVNAVVHMVVTGSDVIHAWAIPSFGSKVDAVPGRLNETWFRAEETGVFYGQCSELCGMNHTYMPIVVEVVSQPDYDAWVQTQQALNDAAPIAEPTKLAANK